jgi:hypothetical protein
MHRNDRRLSPSRLLKRPRRLGTTVALAIGIAAVPTVALAVTTDALPGDPFELGQENKIANATTTVTGTDSANNTLNGVLHVRRESGSGAVLKVENTTSGIIGGQGIDIRVAPGKRPITVSADAGKSNLNVDKLDGRDEEDFLPTRLYGNGTTSLIEGKGAGKPVLITALSGLECDEGDIALNAGFRAQDPASDVAGDDESDLVAMEPFRSSYTIELRDNGLPSQYRANIICMDNARPFR